MDFIKLAEQRFSVRQFKPDPIEPEKMELILKAGRLAPTACNMQPQRVFVMQGEQALEKLRKITTCHYGASAALMVCFDCERSFKRMPDGQDSGWVDASIVTTHMMLEAADLGVGSTWVMYFDPEKVRAELQLPDSYVPAALLVMGYAADGVEPNPFHTTYLPDSELIFNV